MKLCGIGISFTVHRNGLQVPAAEYGFFRVATCKGEKEKGEKEKRDFFKF